MGGELIDLRSLRNRPILEIFDFLIDLKVILECDFLKSSFLMDLKSYILRKSDFYMDSIFL